MKKSNSQITEENEDCDITLNEEESTPEITETVAKVEHDALLGELEEIKKKCDEYMKAVQYAQAEFINYKNRSTKEKEALYCDSTADVVEKFLPVLDNLIRADEAVVAGGDLNALKDGFRLVFKQLKETFENIGVKEIKSVGEKFNPDMHNAVMHFEDETFNENEITEEFQKGYIFKDKVIRHSMVKVAN
jgi:molecular chaperone GrpE